MARPGWVSVLPGIIPPQFPSGRLDSDSSPLRKRYPSTLYMIMEALADLNEEQGSHIKAIHDWIRERYPLLLESIFESMFETAMREGFQRRLFVNPDGNTSRLQLTVQKTNPVSPLVNHSFPESPTDQLMFKAKITRNFISHLKYESFQARSLKTIEVKESEERPNPISNVEESESLTNFVTNMTFRSNTCSSPVACVSPTCLLAEAASTATATSFNKTVRTSKGKRLWKSLKLGRKSKKGFSRKTQSQKETSSSALESKTEIASWRERLFKRK